MQWNFIFCGVLALFFGAYLDSIRGPLLPVLTREFSLTYSETSWFLIAGNIAAFFANLLLIPLYAKWGERAVTRWLCWLGLFTTGFAFLIQNYLLLLILAVLIGSTISTLGVACNLLAMKGTSPTYRARVLCGLHMMFGVGSLLAPGCLGLFLDRGIHWPSTLLPFAAGMFGLAAAVGLLPNDRAGTAAPVISAKRPSRAQWVILASFGIYVCAEVMMSVWMMPYLVEFKHLTVVQGAPYVSGFFLAIAVTRFLCLVFLSPRFETTVLVGSLVAACGFFAAGHAGWLPGLALSGVLGPFFPLFLARVSRTFETQITRLTIWSLATVQGSLALCHLLTGYLTDQVGIQKSYGLPFALLGITVGLFFLYVSEERRLS